MQDREEGITAHIGMPENDLMNFRMPICLALETTPYIDPKMARMDNEANTLFEGRW